MQTSGPRLRGGWIERRDERQKVLIRARMRSDGLPVDVCICDVSARGACIMTARPPARGSVVELMDMPIPVVGEVTWSSARRFGLSTGSRIDILASLRRGSATADRAAATKAAPSRPNPANKHQASRWIGKMVEFALIVCAGAVVAGAFGELVFHQLRFATRSAEQGMTVGR